ncbi:hypothetical protein CDL12_21951 [Handroanthus impetiginosus]|uniref:DUF8040 domain-containing protein n=1 Tax=Handroanthus impetiginosus TaxID=429701 RepID=A0A2G9GJN7_9LAMI|nr:hypothetical protein CDL12_21951 [Handroanthus impetiginosus]
MIFKIPDQFKHMRQMVKLSDQACINNLRMDTNSIFQLCYILERVGGLHNKRYAFVPEHVASFLLIHAHHTKNRIIKHNFRRSGQTNSKYISQTLKAIIKTSGLLLVKLVPVSHDCPNDTCKHLKICFLNMGCFGALDGTFITNTSRKYHLYSRKNLLQI